MKAWEQGEDVVTLCNKCQQPVADPAEGNDGEPYHRRCGKSLAMFE